MYNKFFGFHEKPFKLVPNPAYFFLSKSHEEALAHLNYAISQGDGFVEITGEVGTGKTTLCRAFLESLNSETEAAYIFNPKMGPKQLLQTIHDEFGLESESSTIKELIDQLNAFLMQKKSEGKKAVLLIDEAQNLTQHVLEQLRLLSNLETNQDKLLQIILVGQPELGQMLDSHELRQVGQRITLSYHLLPLSFKETKGYIEHRINKATQKKGVRFESGALRQIFNFSRGIPRLINIVCDRTLLTAYVLNQKRISTHVAKAAVRELAGRGAGQRSAPPHHKKGLALLAALGGILILLLFFQIPLRDLFSPARPQKANIAYPVRAAISPPVAPRPEPVVPKNLPENIKTPPPKPPLDLASYLQGLDAPQSRSTALESVLSRWNTPFHKRANLEQVSGDDLFFRLAARFNGFEIERLALDFKLLKALDLPAILEFFPQGGPQKTLYLALEGLSSERAVLKSADGLETIETDLNGLRRYGSGIVYLPWKNFLSLNGVIPTRTTSESIVALKLYLSGLGFRHLTVNDDYDTDTLALIKQIQAKYGIPADGRVGPLTKIVCYREKEAFEMPKLNFSAAQ